jgi:hypothetical protein
MGCLLQELIDTIIDQFAPQGEAATPDRHYVREPQAAALRACALTSRSFLPRCLEHLFASVDCNTARSSKLEALVSESPQILTSYVKYATITLDSEIGESTDVDFTLASQILGLVPKLVYLSICSDLHPLQWNTQPTFFQKCLQ